MKENNLSVQEWLDIESILDNGIVKLKNKYIKIIKIMPINYNLKSNLEKESILNSYKIFLKTCNFNIQILIQSNKEDLKNIIKNIEDNLKKEKKEFLNEIGKNFINFLNNLNSSKTSSSKEFFIIISSEKNLENNMEELIIEELEEKFLKVKECILRCGNNIENLNSKEETEKVLYTFLNKRLSSI